MKKGRILVRTSKGILAEYRYEDPLFGKLKVYELEEVSNDNNWPIPGKLTGKNFLCKRESLQVLGFID